MLFQLQGAQALADLAADASRVRFQDACHLHGQGGTSGDDATAGNHLTQRTHRGYRIDARVLPEPAVFVADQGLQVERGDFVDGNRVTPDALRIGKCAQRRSIPRQHHGAAVIGIGQGQGKRAVEHEGDQQQDAAQDGTAAQAVAPRLAPRRWWAHVGSSRHHGKVCTHKTRFPGPESWLNRGSLGLPAPAQMA